MRKSKKIISMIIIILLFINSIVNAASLSCSLSMKSTSQTIKAGETVQISVSVDQLTLSDNAPGITILDGYLEYDNNIFEEVKKSNIDCGDNRSVTYNSTNKRIYIEYDNEQGLIKENGTVIFTLSLKAKADANIDTTQVKINNIVLTDNNEEFKINSISLQLNKTEEKDPNDPEQKPDDPNGDSGNTEQKPDDPNGDSGNTEQKPDDSNGDSGNTEQKPDDSNGDSGNTDQKPGNTNGDSDKNNSQISSGNKDNTTKPNNLPNTGLQNVVIISIIFISLIISILFYCKYISYKQV